MSTHVIRKGETKEKLKNWCGYSGNLRKREQKVIDAACKLVDDWNNNGYEISRYDLKKLSDAVDEYRGTDK